MSTTTPFRTGRSALMLALISAAFAGNAAASAGRIDFSIGGVVATRASGQQRPLVKGDELESGDTIHTNNGRAQIRFPDGAYVSLQPNTVFGVKEYNYDGKPDGSERGFFSLLKGAMRAVTGLIGRVHRNAFQIATPTATVGIRGTGGLIVVLPDGSTLIRGSSGIWSLSNASGSIDVPAGTSGLAPADPSQPPEETSETPSVPPAPPGTESTGFVSGDERTDTGDPVVPTIVPLATGSGYGIAVAFDGFPMTSGDVKTDAVFNGSGQLTSATLTTYSLQYDLLSGTNADFGTDGILAWGRWVGDVQIQGCDCTSPVTYDANQGLHYVVGMPTPVMPTTGSAIFTLIEGGATHPTYTDGHTAPGTFAGSLEVLFGARAPSVTMAFSITMPDGKQYLLNGSPTSYSGAMFSALNAYNVTGAAGGACSGSGCYSDIQGFFSGANAARAGVAYHINDNSTQDIVGAAAFKNTGAPVPAP